MDGENCEKVKYNMDLKSFYQQLAKDSGERGFQILKVPEPSRPNMRRNSAPAVFDEATRKMLSDNTTAKAGKRSSDCTHQRRHSADDDAMLLDTIFDEAVESVLDEVDDILYGEDFSEHQDE